MSLLYHAKKYNFVGDALSWLSMNSIAHIESKRKELVKDVHRLAYSGVRLNKSNEGGILVHNGTESPLKTKQDINSSLVELNKLVVDKKIEVLSQEEDGVLHDQG